MSWRKEQRRTERGYHHGNLKEALLQAALGLIAEKGAAGFTFADAARMAGVSPAAPYRHFRDRDELLSSIAQRGFEQFEAALTEAWDDGRPDTVTAFERVGKAYLAFAREEPAFYSAMFESGLPVDVSPALMAASERAFGIIRAAAARVRMDKNPGWFTYVNVIYIHNGVMPSWRGKWPTPQMSIAGAAPLKSPTTARICSIHPGTPAGSPSPCSASSSGGRSASPFSFSHSGAEKWLAGATETASRTRWSGCATAWSAAVFRPARPPAATAPSTNTAWKPCGGSRKSRPSSRHSSTGCVTPRTRKSSTSSWRSTAHARRHRPRTASRRRDLKVEFEG